MGVTDTTPRRKPVRKAVIPAAGLGTRFLPFSKAVPKEMLPVVDRPVIQYVIEEAVAAGIEDILIVTSRHKKVLEDHFDRMPELEAALAAKGKDEEVAQIRALSEMAQLHFVRQGEAKGLGHAIGMAVVHLGGGRMREGDRIEPSVGVSDMLGLGAEVGKGQPVARIHASNAKAADKAERDYLAAIEIGEPGDVPPLVMDRIG